MVGLFKSQKLQDRILRGYSLPLGVLVLFGIVIGTVVQLNNSVREDLARANRVIENMRETVIGASRALRAARGAALFPEELASYQETYGKAREKIEKHAPLALAEIREEKIKELWTEFEKQLGELTEGTDEVMKLLAAGKTQEAVQKIKGIRAAGLDEKADEIIKAENEIIESIGKRAELIGNIAILITLVGIFGGGGFSLVLANNIAKAIAQEIQQAVAQISASAAQIAASMEEQEKTASLQAASVNETTTTMDQLRASAHQSEEQAAAAATAAQEVLRLAQQGNHSVEETVAAMIDLKNKVGAIADQIVRLSEQTSQIGSISSLVNDLAQQTNMLALNASVEAVRAGEYGKGFAVVAEEIRKLAEQSRQSALHIGQLVTDIQNAINTTVMVTDEGTKTANAGMSITENTAKAFSSIVEAINTVAMNNQQILLNIRQQGKAVEQVLEAMEAINKGAQEAAASITQVGAGTAQLSATAKNLESMI
ncbi:MAG: methyl-accepting chemotaxis protein [Geminocystis sp.]|nr:methyl-accepting chemotaxis protein [Geminocystis sp.]HIK36989.1 methyl-accepting chemotaxis protein [Geminocystis sp. M7585_C2015_104]